MKRIMLGLGVAAALAVPGVAAADSSAGQCSSATHGATWSSAGDMFQSARAGYGVNPRDLAAVHGASVGQLVQAACRS
jgi:hypothetical protein